MSDEAPGTSLEVHPDFPHIDPRGHRNATTRAWEERWCRDQRVKFQMEYRDIRDLYNETFAPARISLDTVFQRIKDYENRILAEAKDEHIATVRDVNLRTADRYRARMTMHAKLATQADAAIDDIAAILEHLGRAVLDGNAKLIEALSKALVALGAIGAEANKTLDSARADEKQLIDTMGWAAPKQTEATIKGALTVEVVEPDDELDRFVQEASEAEERVRMELRSGL